MPHEQVAAEVSGAALCKGLPSGVEAENHHIRPYEIAKVIAGGDSIDLGNRMLEIISIPGHTPDAIALWDRKNGLLWTGDSFYLGPIWLFADETDWEAYKMSISRIALLAPQLKTLLPAHNTPTADPSYLISLDEAIRKVDDKRVTPVIQGDGNKEYMFEGFSILTK